MPRPVIQRLPAEGRPDLAWIHAGTRSVQAVAGTHCLRPRGDGNPYCHDAHDPKSLPTLGVEPGATFTLRLSSRGKGVTARIGRTDLRVEPEPDPRRWRVRLPAGVPRDDVDVEFAVEYLDFDGDAPVPFTGRVRAR
jgi:hypothetical protein